MRTRWQRIRPNLDNLGTAGKPLATQFTPKLRIKHTHNHQGSYLLCRSDGTNGAQSNSSDSPSSQPDHRLLRPLRGSVVPDAKQVGLNEKIRQAREREEDKRREEGDARKRAEEISAWMKEEYCLHAERRRQLRMAEDVGARGKEGEPEQRFYGVFCSRPGVWLPQIHVVVDLSTDRLVPTSRGRKYAKKKTFRFFPPSLSPLEAAIYRDLGQLWKQEMIGVEYKRDKVNCPAVWEGKVAPGVMAALWGAKTVTAAKEVFFSPAVRTEVLRLTETMPETGKAEGNDNARAAVSQAQQQQQQVHGGGVAAATVVNSPAAAAAVVPTVASTVAPAAVPSPTLDGMQDELEALLHRTPGLLLSEDDVFAFMAHFVCNAETRSSHLRMLRKSAGEGKPTQMKTYVQNVLHALMK